MREFILRTRRFQRRILSWNQAVSSEMTGTIRMTAAASPGLSRNIITNTPST